MTGLHKPSLISPAQHHMHTALLAVTHIEQPYGEDVDDTEASPSHTYITMCENELCSGQ